MRALVTVIVAATCALASPAAAQSPEGCATYRYGSCSCCTSTADSGYWHPFGGSPRMLSTELEFASGDRDVYVGRLDVRGAVFELHPQLLFVGIQMGILSHPEGELFPSPTLELGTLITSRCQRFRLEISTTVLPQSIGSAGPADIEAAVLGALTSGVENASLWLPRSDFGYQLNLRMRWLLPDIADAVVLVPGMFASAGQSRLDTWLGPQRTLVGSVGVDFEILLLPVNVRVSGRLAIAVGAAFSAGQVAPYTFEGAIGWAPLSELDVEIFVGAGDFVLEELTQSVLVRTGLRVTGYFDYPILGTDPSG